MILFSAPSGGCVTIFRVPTRRIFLHTFPIAFLQNSDSMVAKRTNGGVRMTHETVSPLAPESVPLQKAVLCVDCELVTTSRSDVCPVCGGRSLLSLASIIGGTLVDYRDNRFREQRLILFDLHIAIDMTEIEGEELSAAIEGISRIVSPKLGRNRASVHIDVSPIVRTSPTRLKAA